MIWVSYDMPVGRLRQWRIGSIDLWLHHLPNEWRSATQSHPDRSGVAEEAALSEDGNHHNIPEHLDIYRWSVKSASANQALLRPSMPDRPIVVRTAAPMSILPGSEALFFISVPVWIEVFIGEKGDEKMMAIPTATLSNSWFGLPTNGEICYALRTHARRDLDEFDKTQHRAICPMTIRNESKAPLPVQRLFLRTDPLSIYAGQDHLWTNPGTLRYQGEDKPMRIAYEQEAPPYDDAKAVLREARQAKTSSVLARSFTGIREVFAL